ncbi:MAG: phosphatase PAP2 family protein [Ignavibacteriaceae bacterium]
MHRIKSFLHNLKAYDLVVVVFCIFLSLINIFYQDKIPQWQSFILINIGIIIFAFILAYLEDKYNSRIIRIIHYWYIAPLILLTFKQLYFIIKPIRGEDFDHLFIAADRWLFGTDPTHFLYQFSHPVLTEILQIIYGLFYFLPIILALALLRKRKYLATDYAVFSVIYGFYLSYLGYFALPGIGPRFILHDFHSINTELPGLWATNFLRELINIGESIPAGTPNPAEVVQRDIFPSGHTMITLIVMYLSVKLKSRSKYFLLPAGALLIFSTVYLRYHYVIDLIGGLVFMIFSVWSGKHLFNWWQRRVGKEEFEYSLNLDEKKE